jgi:hypothetical protein
MSAPARASIEGFPAPSRRGYIVGPFYDGLFFVFSPLLALALGVGIAGTRFATVPVEVAGLRVTPSHLLISVFISAHLVIVFVRSHVNAHIFRQFPLRFTLIPVLLLAATFSSYFLMALIAVVGVWWDVYHSSLQTFGLGRIYDAKRSNGPQVGRRLDYLLNLLLYLGPILAGATLMDHMAEFSAFDRVGAPRLAAIPSLAEAYQGWLTVFVLGLGAPFLVFYVLRYWQYYRRGYRVSPQKVALLASTGACSITSWGFNSFGEAFFVMNFFHALQYFALVWHTERRSLASLVRLDGSALAGPAAFALLVVPALAYGWWATANATSDVTVFCVVAVVSILHYWYDGFIWSVRKGQV